jgi:hypothetical protein
MFVFERRKLMAFTVYGDNMSNLVAKWRFNIAVEYLRHSDLASSIIEDLENATQLITVKVGTGFEDAWIPPGNVSVNSGGTIEWHPTSTLNTIDRPANRPKAPWVAGGRAHRGVQSAALGLFHEMVHALQYLANAEQMVGASVNVLEVENFVVQGVEATVARELTSSGHMESVRWHYHDTA